MSIRPGYHARITSQNMVAPIDKQTPAPAAAKIGIASTCTQIGVRAAGATPPAPVCGVAIHGTKEAQNTAPRIPLSSNVHPASHVYIPYFACLQCMHGAQPRQPVASYHDQKAEACNAQLAGEDHSALDKRGAIP